MIIFFFVATLALATTGNGQEANSCAGCDPAVPICSQGCQNYITNVYWDCDSVCLPDGYYFDPRKYFSVIFHSFLYCFLSFCRI